MCEAIEKRLEILNTEYEKGKTMLVEYEQKSIELRNILLRISGAIQALEETLAETRQEKING